MNPAPERRLRRLGRRDLPADTIALARYLIGKILVHDTPAGRLAGRIVETEAYLPHDAASHAYRGETPRNLPMFAARGIAYVYLSYGVHWCFNVVSERRGVGAAVLVRALEPLEGVDAMRANRAGSSDRDLARGPGRLTAALGIDARYSGVDLCAGGALWLGDDGFRPPRIATGTRVGITKDVERPWRFWLAGSPAVSGRRTL